ncbi:MAG: PTS lactose/cellobiose transporter subunit IIA [Clostridiaceae bacterium]
MDEKIAQNSMELISYSGCAKGLASEAFNAILSGDIETSKAKLKEAGEELGKAHEIQTSLMVSELNGENIEKSVLLIHAQDHFMTASTFRDMVAMLIQMYEKLNNK